MNCNYNFPRIDYYRDWCADNLYTHPYLPATPDPGLGQCYESCIERVPRPSDPIMQRETQIGSPSQEVAKLQFNDVYTQDFRYHRLSTYTSAQKKM